MAELRKCSAWNRFYMNSWFIVSCETLKIFWERMVLWHGHPFQWMLKYFVQWLFAWMFARNKLAWNSLRDNCHADVGDDALSSSSGNVSLGFMRRSIDCIKRQCKNETKERGPYDKTLWSFTKYLLCSNELRFSVSRYFKFGTIAKA